MTKTQFLKTMNQLQGDERNLFILSCGLMNNSKIQSVNDIERTLGITLSKDEVVSMNKYMFTVSTICKMTGTDLFEYLSDEYCKLMI
jgi:hypothetical protein